jgi:hypothetical protein
LEGLEQGKQISCGKGPMDSQKIGHGESPDVGGKVLGEGLLKGIPTGSRFGPLQ